jgi:hypothetical protein
MKTFLVLALMISPLLASAMNSATAWREMRPVKGTVSECADSEKQKIYSANGSQLLICYFDSIDQAAQARAQFSEKRIVLKESYSLGFKSSSSSAANWFATEGEMGAHARTLEFNEETVLVSEDDGQGHAVLSRSIVCKSRDCFLDQPNCVLKSTAASQKAVGDLVAATKKAKSAKVWANYFDGKMVAQGQLVIDEAILGSKEARDVIQRLSPDSGSAAGSEIFATIQGDIEDFGRYCAPAHETKTKVSGRAIDCLAKKTVLAKTVCASPELQRLDTRINSLFDADSASDRHEWYELLSSCKADVPCLKKEYNDEIFRLSHK